MSETRFSFEVQPTLPEKIAGLNDLANNLLYSWDRGVRKLFYRLDAKLWESSGHNPKVFLRQIAQEILDDAADDHIFLEEYNRLISSYQTYHEKVSHPRVENVLDNNKDLIAYFCAEFGFHESIPIYSGGLGILAGDHCKAASDLGLPFVAIGLLYRQGYFTQTIDAHGNQEASYHPTNFEDLPIKPAVDSSGKEIHVNVHIGDHSVSIKVWQAQAGHITIYLLDTDLPENNEHDRSITFQLYGGDKTTRIQQEIVLGIGGVRALRALGLEPNIWHINEGHSAFQILERCRDRVETGMDFDSAKELVAAGTVFTTHTPVAAGHDIFTRELIEQYFTSYAEELGITMDHFFEMGSTPSDGQGFNMTALALRGSRFHNGVSRIHGSVASDMEGYIWPEIPHKENPISYVTNGVHAPTFLAPEWINLFDMRFRSWRNQLLNPKYWNNIDDIPNHRFWSLRQELKSQLMEYVHQKIVRRGRRTGCSVALLERMTCLCDQPESDVLVIGFARRFATYKRATLLFSDPQRLSRLLNDDSRPVVLIFAGKAHPHDVPGQELIRTIHDYSMQPEFLGKIILLEGYDMALARKMVSGVDVWLNTPEYPLEASGTSGQKAALNGVVNVSVLDGWWGEGYNGKNGWAISPHELHFDSGYRDREESHDLLNILENEVIPMYFNRGNHGYSNDWVKVSKESMKSSIPLFNAQRMLIDYVEHFYAKARDQRNLIANDNYSPAKELSEWKKKIDKNWRGVKITRLDEVKPAIKHGEHLPIQVSASLNGLSPEDVTIECLIGKDIAGEYVVHDQQRFQHVEQKGDEQIFKLDLIPLQPGLNVYKIRIYPYHSLLAHPYETGYMVWL